MSTICDGLINQYKPNYKTAFSARFDKQDENDQVLNEVELFINLKIIQNWQSLIWIMLIFDLKWREKSKTKRQKIVIGGLIKINSTKN